MGRQEQYSQGLTRYVYPPQLVEIIKVLGTPTKAQIKAMNKNYTDFKFPQIKGGLNCKVTYPLCSIYCYRHLSLSLSRSLSLSLASFDSFPPFSGSLFSFSFLFCVRLSTAHSWDRVFHNSADPQAVDLVAKMLAYAPQERLTPLQVR